MSLGYQDLFETSQQRLHAAQAELKAEREAHLANNASMRKRMVELEAAMEAAYVSKNDLRRTINEQLSNLQAERDNNVQLNAQIGKQRDDVAAVEKENDWLRKRIDELERAFYRPGKIYPLWPIEPIDPSTKFAAAINEIRDRVVALEKKSGEPYRIAYPCGWIAYPCGCVATGSPDLPKYCATHGSTPDPSANQQNFGAR